MHNKYHFEGQEIDNTVCYLPCKEVAEMAGRSRTSVFNDIQMGRLPAVWHTVCRCGKKSRAYLVHPNDAKAYVEKVKGKRRVNWGK